MNNERNPEESPSLKMNRPPDYTDTTTTKTLRFEDTPQGIVFRCPGCQTVIPVGYGDTITCCGYTVAFAPANDGGNP